MYTAIAENLNNEQMKGAPNFAKAFIDVLKNAINGIQREVVSKVFYILLKKYCS